MSATFIIGASGAIGSELTRYLLKRDGPGSVICALHRTPLPKDLIELGAVQAFGVNMRDEKTLDRVFAQHAAKIQTVWNLAAPLSVDTAKDPTAAHDVVVNGMARLLRSMQRHGLARIVFSDSIGSFGGTGPRGDATGRWLVDNPTQDPGSDYGKQKRQCRELLAEYSSQHGFDTRWAVIPGVLHADASWGAGTTEYALEAIKAAATRAAYVCPVPLQERLPFIYISDLIRALVALAEAHPGSLREPSAGYALAGFSFSPAELFAELRAEHASDFRYSVDTTSSAAATFAQLWPDALSAKEAARDLGYTAAAEFKSTIATIYAAHLQHAAQSPRAKL